MKQKSHEFNSNHTKKKIFGVILFFFLLLGIFLRFYKITEKGVHGSDTILYSNIAKSWSEGNFIYQIGNGQLIIRPVIFSIYGGAIYLFGYKDYSIKLINAIIDSLIILLLMFVSYRLSNQNRWAALSAGMIYALLPMAITYSRTELTHTISALMVLVTFLFFMFYMYSKRNMSKYLFIILSGIFSGLTALSHDELIFITPAFLIFLLADSIFFSRREKNLKRVLLDCGIYLTSSFIICHKLLFHHLSNIFIAISDKSRRPEELIGRVERFFRYIWNGISANTSIIFLLVFLLLILFIAVNIVFKRMRKKKTHVGFPPLLYLLILILFVYLLLYAYFSPVFFTRLFFPFIPLAIIAVIIGYEKVLKRFRIKWTNVILIIFCFSIIPFNLEHFKNHPRFTKRKYSYEWENISGIFNLNIMKGYKVFWNKNYKKTWGRKVYEKLKIRVNENARILVTSSIIYPSAGRRVLQLDFYFSDNAIYLIDHSEPLEELINKYNVKYILFTLYWADRRMLKRKPPFFRYKYYGEWEMTDANPLGKSYGFGPGEYTVEKEYDFLNRYLKKKKATPIFKHGNIGKKSIESFNRSKKVLWTDQSYIIFEL